MARANDTFDPRAILAALERNYVDYVLIGGLARVLRGSYETTRGVDLCPSFGEDNIERLGQAVGELEAQQADGRKRVFDERTLGGEDVVAFSTAAGELKIVPSPAGAPNGFVDLRRAATKEHLGHGLQPLVASTGDLARMAAALHRDQDVARLSELRRIMELEVDREPMLVPPARRPARTSERSAKRERRLER
jgi:hypothetical protein